MNVVAGRGAARRRRRTLQDGGLLVDHRHGRSPARALSGGRTAFGCPAELGPLNHRRLAADQGRPRNATRRRRYRRRRRGRDAGGRGPRGGDGRRGQGLDHRGMLGAPAPDARGWRPVIERAHGPSGRAPGSARPDRGCRRRETASRGADVGPEGSARIAAPPPRRGAAASARSGPSTSGATGSGICSAASVSSASRTNRSGAPPRGRAADHGAPVGDALDQPDPLQLGQRLAHDMALHPEPFREFLLDEALARQEPAEDDLLLQHGGDGADAVGGLGLESGIRHARS